MVNPNEKRYTRQFLMEDVAHVLEKADENNILKIRKVMYSWVFNVFPIIWCPLTQYVL